MTTINQHIDSVQAQFRGLSASRRSTLVRQAREYIAKNPACADNNGFWRALSARQVLAANAAAK